MSQTTHRAARQAWITVVGAGALALTAAASSPGAELTMYETVPSAEEMMATLLGGIEQERGGRSRSVRMKPEATPETTSRAAPGILGFTLQFALDSHQVAPEDRSFLDELARVMTLPEMEGKALVVEGHTDARGSDAYNESLSLRRAGSVIAYLVEEHGIASARLIPVGRGEQELLDRADPMAGVNRRVQFYLPGAK